MFKSFVSSVLGGDRGMGLMEREGEIYWSIPPPSQTAYDALAPPISEELLEDWISDTVGWHAIEITAESLIAAHRNAPGGALSTKALIQASFEAAARMHTKRVRLSWVDLDAVLGRCIGMGLAAYPNLDTLALRELNVYDEAILPLGQSLRGSEGLQKVSLNQIDMSSSGWNGFLLSLSTQVSILKFRQCLPYVALSSLAHSLPSMKRLTRLDVAGNNLRDRDLAKLCEGVVHCPNLQFLSLADNSLGTGPPPPPSNTLSALLAGSGTPLPSSTYSSLPSANVSNALQDLLSANKSIFTKPGEEKRASVTPSMIAAAVAAQASVNSSSLSGRLIAEIIRRCGSSLQSLDVSLNPDLGAQGCADVSRALTCAPNLTALILSRCGADDTSVDLVIKAINQGRVPELKRIDMGFGRVTSGGAQRIAAICKNRLGSGLQHIDLSGSCLLGTAGVKAFKTALASKVCRLVTLNLGDCEAGDEAAEALAESLASLPQVVPNPLYRSSSSTDDPSTPQPQMQPLPQPPQPQPPQPQPQPQPPRPPGSIQSAHNESDEDESKGPSEERKEEPTGSSPHSSSPNPALVIQKAKASSGGILAVFGLVSDRNEPFKTIPEKKGCQSLTHLDVSSNQFTSRGLGALSRAARKSPSLRFLSVSFNWAGPRAMAASLAPAQPPSFPPGSHPYVNVGRNLTLEIISEISEEFREIERIKFSVLGPGGSNQGQEAAKLPPSELRVDSDDPPYNPFASAPSLEVRGEDLDPSLLLKPSDYPTITRPGRQLPGGFIIPSENSGTGQGSSCRTLMSEETEEEEAEGLANEGLANKGGDLDKLGALQGHGRNPPNWPFLRKSYYPEGSVLEAAAIVAGPDEVEGDVEDGGEMTQGSAFESDGVAPSVRMLALTQHEDTGDSNPFSSTTQYQMPERQPRHSYAGFRKEVRECEDLIDGTINLECCELPVSTNPFDLPPPLPPLPVSSLPSPMARKRHGSFQSSGGDPSSRHEAIKLPSTSSLTNSPTSMEMPPLTKESSKANSMHRFFFSTRLDKTNSAADAGNPFSSPRFGGGPETAANPFSKAEASPATATQDIHPATESENPFQKSTNPFK